MTAFARELEDEDFNSKVLHAAGLVLVDFWAGWCAPCRAIAPFIERIAEEFQGEITVLKVDIDRCPRSAAALGIRSVPTLIIFRDGEILREQAGAPDPKQLIDYLESLLEAGDGQA